MTRAAGQRLRPSEHHGGGFRLDPASGQDEIKAARRLTGREVIGAERGRAAALKRIGQPGGHHEPAEHSTVAVHVEVPAHHGRRRGASHDLRQDV